MNRRTFIIGVIILVLDQITKILTNIFIDTNSSVKVIDGFFSLVNVTNTGAAFSILEGRTFFLVMLTLLVIVMILKMRKDFDDKRYVNVAFGFLMGGILGNLVDRLFLGSVRDFLKFRIFGYNFPVFNVADMAIVIGVILLIINIFRGESNGSSSKRRNKREN